MFEPGINREKRQLKVLLVFSPERPDHFRYFENDDTLEYSILWEKVPTKRNHLPGFIKQEYFWDHYPTARKLLNDVKPDRIVFSQIYDLLQISLNIVARSLGIPCFYIDHGAASSLEIGIERHLKDHRQNLLNKVKTFYLRIPSIIRNRIFYFSALSHVSPPNRLKFLALPSYMLNNTSAIALHKINFDERKPDYFILFCRNNKPDADFDYHIPIGTEYYSGVPFFDKYYKQEVQEDNHIFYIDHPYLEQKNFNWTRDHHRAIAMAIEKFAVDSDTVVHVKLHPRSSIDIWKQYQLNEEKVKIYQWEDCTELMLKAKLILGFSSTLLTGLLSAKKNIVVLGWNPKPEIKGFNPASMLLAHASYSIDDLKSKVPEWIANNLCKTNINEYNKFITNFNYPFDGRATNRIIKYILSNNQVRKIKDNQL